MNGPAWVVARAREQPDGDALRGEEGVVTWSQLARDSETTAARLSAVGVARGDIVAASMTAGPRLVSLLHAVQLLGAALLPVNLRLAAPELARVLEHAQPRVLVRHDELPAARKSFALPAEIDPRAALTVVYTSGTTGAPKGVVLTNANYEAGAEASRARLGHGAQDVWLGTLPLFHVGGLAMLARSALEGSPIVLEQRFDAAQTASVLERGEATMVSVVPTMLVRVLDKLRSRVAARVRCALVGGASLAPSLARRALDAGLPISATYGMTEACSQICSTAPGSDEAAEGLVGPALDGTEVRIADPDHDGRGEIAVRGATVMRGYLRNDDANRSAVRDGWLMTGDVGRLDERGRLAVAGRRDDLIITGGENVSPVEVEHALDAHPDVEESLVAGLTDAEWGQRIVALVVAREGRRPTPDQLAEWCRTRVASFKVPREIRFVDALPRGATGKVVRDVALIPSLS